MNCLVFVVKGQGHSMTKCGKKMSFFGLPSGQRHRELDAVCQVLTI